MATATTTRPKARKRSTPRGRKAQRWRSRAVLRRIEAGSSVSCSACDEHIKFKAKVKGEQVICNVYVKGVWDRVEHFHAECYEKADRPFGRPQE